MASCVSAFSRELQQLHTALNNAKLACIKYGKSILQVLVSFFPPQKLDPPQRGAGVLTSLPRLAALPCLGGGGGWADGQKKHASGV